MIELSGCVRELDTPATLERLAVEPALGWLDPAVVKQYVDSDQCGLAILPKGVVMACGSSGGCRQ